MDAIRPSPTVGAPVRTPRQLHIHQQPTIRFFHISHDCLFQSEQLGGIIVHRAYAVLSDGCSNFILTGSASMLYFFISRDAKMLGADHLMRAATPTFIIEPE